MSAIVTITFNPALDKSTDVEELISDKKLKCSEPFFEPGGGGINVARAIKKLGGDAVAIYTGGGCTGRKIAGLLRDEAIDSVMTEISGETRENLIVADRSNGKQYLFDMPGPFIRADEWKQCLDDIEKIAGIKFIVASGSLPPGVPPDVFSHLSAIAKRKNARLIADTSGEALKYAVQAGVFMIKPNQKELAALAGAEVSDEAGIFGAAQKIIKTGKCKSVVVSLGALGALLVTANFTCRVIPPMHEIKSTVGAGDSLVAGIVYSLLQNKSLADSVKYGVACGSAATINPGTQLCNKADADELFGKIKVVVPELIAQHAL